MKSTRNISPTPKFDRDSDKTYWSHLSLEVCFLSNIRKHVITESKLPPNLSVLWRGSDANIVNHHVLTS